MLLLCRKLFYCYCYCTSSSESAGHSFKYWRRHLIFLVETGSTALVRFWNTHFLTLSPSAKKNCNGWIFKIRINNSALVYIVFAKLLLISDDKTQSKLSTDKIVKYGDAFVWCSTSISAEEELENRTELGFFLLVIDTASSYADRRFNVEYVLVSLDTSRRWWPEVKTFTMLLNFPVLQSWMGICALQKTTCCSTMRHTDPLLVRRCPCTAFCCTSNSTNW